MTLLENYMNNASFRKWGSVKQSLLMLDDVKMEKKRWTPPEMEPEVFSDEEYQSISTTVVYVLAALMLSGVVLAAGWEFIKWSLNIG